MWLSNLIVFTSFIASVSGFMVTTGRSRHCHRRNAAGQGFGGGSNKKAPEKTYSFEAKEPIRDLIDSEAAMRDFFDNTVPWHPLFASIRSSEERNLPWLRPDQHPNIDDSFATDASNAQVPWGRLPDKPEDDHSRTLLGSFLDAMHASLLDIPVTDSSEDDENDLQFIEEGRRLLAMSRFHVIPSHIREPLKRHDALFATCWNEVKHLHLEDEAHTGSLILVPDVELHNVRRFVDTNLQRPLEWLGLSDHFEVTSLKRGESAIRLIYKLNDIPENVGNDAVDE